MKKKNNGGFSLVEVLAAVTIMSIITTFVCTCITRSAQIDARSDAMLKARIAVSSAVEQLTAVGITAESPEYDILEANSAQDMPWEENDEQDLYPGVKISTQAVRSGSKVLYYHVEVTDDADLVTVTTCIRCADAVRGGAGG